MEIAVIGHHGRDLLKFQKQLLADFIETGCRVVACLPPVENEIKGRLTQMGVEYQEFPLNRTGMNPLEDFWYFIQLLKFLKKRKPDIVFTTAIKPSIYGCLAAQISNIPKIFTLLQGLGFAFQGKGLKSSLAHTFAKILYRLALKKNKVVYFLNNDNLAQFIQLNLVRKEQAHVLNGVGVDTDYYQVSKMDEDNPTFLMIARVIRDKGIMEYAHAARVLKKKYPNIHLKLLGPFDSNPSAIPQEEVGEWEKEGILEYCGVANDVRPYIASANVFVLPSYHEGMPRSVMEAMSMGRPIVTTHAPGCCETVQEGVNGYLVPVGDGDALAEAMEHFILSPESIVAMGRASREMAEDKFDVKKINRQIMEPMELKTKTESLSRVGIKVK